MRDVAEVRHAGKITNEVAREALELLEVDGEGLERIDRELLEAIAVKFGGGPVGLSTLAVALGEEPDTIEDVYEPYLLQLGFLQRTPRGRTITELGRKHVGAVRVDGKLVLGGQPCRKPGLAPACPGGERIRAHRGKQAKRSGQRTGARALDARMAGPLEELVTRIVRRIECFRPSTGLNGQVSASSSPTARSPPASLSAEPGFGS